MAKTLYTIIQDLVTGEYKTATGWDVSISNAKLYTPQEALTEMNSISAGTYVMIDAYVIS